MAVYSNEDKHFFERKTREKDFSMPQEHFHDKHELYVLVHGKTRFLIDDEIYILETSDMIFAPKGSFHKTSTESKNDIERIVISFDGALLGSEYASMLEDLTHRKHIRIQSKHFHIIKEILGKIENEETNKSDNYSELQKLYLKELIIMIFRYRANIEKSDSNSSYEIIRDAAKYIRENYNTDLSLDFLSKKYAMSSSHFSKLFKTVSGVCLSEYINISRISAAERLLRNGKTPISSVATACGFNDSNYFAAVFKKFKGVTPKKYSLRNL